MCDKIYVRIYFCFCCTGTMCEDPGTPPGGSQVISSDGYRLNAEVTFKCDRTDYGPDRTSGISCVLNGTNNGVRWNDSIPSCVGKYSFISSSEL